MKKPLVSIIIPVYNGENYLKEAIDSALNQTYDNIEIIVVNDGSKDNTEKICKSYGKQIRYFKKENGGVSTALNLGISKMKGKYFSWLSHDDRYLPDKIEKQIRFLNNFKNDVVLYSDYCVINSNGKRFENNVILNHEELENKPFYCFLRGALNGITMLIPKKAFDECGNFDVKLKCTQDYDMWLRIFKKYKFVHMKELITETRIHSLQDTNISPVALSEGNVLWTKMIDSVSEKEKIKLEGSLYDFYYNEGKFLLTTPYVEVKNYCIQKCIEIDSERYKSKPIKKEKNGRIKNYYKYLKDHGLIYTLKKAIKKIFK